jgi:manganese transport protein
MARGKFRGLALLGPALVAGVAYIDPGNVATNLSSGARFGYLLTWVIVAANLMAWLVQYLSAKLGLVTGQSVPQLLGDRLGQGWRRPLFWFQAQIVAIATDVAEVIGGAIALKLLFNLPVIYGGLLTGLISMALLALHSRGRIRSFEFVILGLVLVTGIGFVAALFVAPPNAAEAVQGLLPRFGDNSSVLLAAGIVGATIMPHAIYAHSALSRDRFASVLKTATLKNMISATKWDVSIAMLIAGAVNLAILFVGASSLFGVSIENSIEGAYHAIHAGLGDVVAILFAYGLLASGLASSAVGTYAGGEISAGLLRRRLSPLVVRAFTLVPALLIIGLTQDPTTALVYSQVLLSFGIPFALFPLVRLTSNREIMGEHANGTWTRRVGYLIAALITALNVYLLALTLLSR